jgi:16S rRNA (adenine1518-N6/adenine1519-N6)-dimethyltransferase
VSAALGRAETRALLERHGVRPDRSLGQHFLAEPNVVDRIVEVSGVGPGSRVVEVGAGAGTLTRALAAAGASVVAYEIDEHLRPVLEEALEGWDVDLRFADAAGVDPIVEGDGWVMVANLPYNVGTPLVLDALRHAPGIERFVVMLQREAVDRLAAPPGSRTYGVPSVVVGLHGRIDVAVRVSPRSFIPPPEVESSVAVIERIDPPAGSERAIELAAAAFGQRRKMLRSALRGILPHPEAALAAAGLDPTERAERIAPSGWVALAEAAP